MWLPCVIHTVLFVGLMLVATNIYKGPELWLKLLHVAEEGDVLGAGTLLTILCTFLAGFYCAYNVTGLWANLLIWVFGRPGLLFGAPESGDVEMQELAV